MEEHGAKYSFRGSGSIQRVLNEHLLSCYSKASVGVASTGLAGSRAIRGRFQGPKGEAMALFPPYGPIDKTQRAMLEN